MKTKSYCSKRHGTPNGAAMPGKLPNCEICNQHGLDTYGWYCPNCYHCLKCQRVIKDKYVKGKLPEIPNTVLKNRCNKNSERIKIPKFTHTTNKVREYCFRLNYTYVKDYATDITLTKREDIINLLNGKLNLLR